MLEYILALVLVGATSLQLDVRGRVSSDCTAARLDVPVAEGGVIYFESGGVQYEGVEAPNGMLVLLTDGERPLSLSGDHRTGGRWTRGEGADCGGAWHTVE